MGKTKRKSDQDIAAFLVAKASREAAKKKAAAKKLKSKGSK